MTQHPEQRSFRARHLAGPLARVSLHTAGRVVLLYLATTIVAFLAGGIAWWAAIGLAVVPTLLAAAIAVTGFRQVARRCSRCGEWAELVDDGAGQALCARCWQVIAGPGRSIGSSGVASFEQVRSWLWRRCLCHDESTGLSPCPVPKCEVPGWGQLCDRAEDAMRARQRCWHR